VCVRWAIDAGAGLVKPTFVKRTAESLSVFGENTHVPIEYLMDEEFLWEVCVEVGRRRGREERGGVSFTNVMVC
jgi:hypothetical protein